MARNIGPFLFEDLKMEACCIFVIFIILVFIYLFISVIKNNNNDSTLIIDNIEVSGNMIIQHVLHKGDFHRISYYNNIIEVETYHYSSNGCRSGFNLDMKFEVPYTNPSIEVLNSGSYNKTFKIFNPENKNEFLYLIGKWVCLDCDCYTWKWKIMENTTQYKTLIDRRW